MCTAYPRCVTPRETDKRRKCPISVSWLTHQLCEHLARERKPSVTSQVILCSTIGAGFCSIISWNSVITLIFWSANQTLCHCTTWALKTHRNRLCGENKTWLYASETCYVKMNVFGTVTSFSAQTVQVLCHCPNTYGHDCNNSVHQLPLIWVVPININRDSTFMHYSQSKGHNIADCSTVWHTDQYFLSSVKTQNSNRNLGQTNGLLHRLDYHHWFHRSLRAAPFIVIMFMLSKT